jgi:Ni,Fe-hydrogenase I cytochrome b subunit
MNPIRSIRLHHLMVASWTLIALGIVAFVTGILVTDGELWQLAGVMLVLAGGVKVAMIHIWHRVAGMETDRHDPVPPV